MSMEMIYLLMCVAIILGAMSACFYFAKKDSLGYALFAFVIAALVFSSAASVLNASRASPEKQAAAEIK